MPEHMVTIFETAFNLAYLTTVWILVALMARKFDSLDAHKKPLGGRFLLAFVLLASGDTGHVGARVVQAILGPEGATVALAGRPASLLGLGMLATAYTMTVFYMVIIDVRRRRAGGAYTAEYWILQAALLVRLIIMSLPGNDWDRSVTPHVMSLVRNLPLTVVGVWLAVNMILEGVRQKDKAWAAMGWCVAVSYAFYAPVILFASDIPLLGLLMIPKTLAYVALGIIAYRAYWPLNTASPNNRSATPR